MERAINYDNFIDHPWGSMAGKRGVERPKENVISLAFRKPRHSVLVVEDDMSSMHAFDVALQATGQFAKFDWATNADEAIRLLQDRIKSGRTNPYDLIVIDIFLDGRRTGIDLWKFLNQENLLSIPVVMTSGVTEEVFHSLIGAGKVVPKFLRKPFQMNNCMGMIYEAMTKPTWN